MEAGVFCAPATRSSATSGPAGAGIPIAGFLGTYRHLEPPTLDEGFDAICVVTIDGGRSAVAPAADAA